MKNIYHPTKEEKKSFQSDLLRFNHYAGRKIAEFKRPPRPKPKIASKRRGRRTQSPESTASDNDETQNPPKAKLSKKTSSKTPMKERNNKISPHVTDDSESDGGTRNKTSGRKCNETSPASDTDGKNIEKNKDVTNTSFLHQLTKNTDFASTNSNNDTTVPPDPLYCLLILKIQR